jgi:hypothetical protein
MIRHNKWIRKCFVCLWPYTVSHYPRGRQDDPNLRCTLNLREGTLGDKWRENKNMGKLAVVYGRIVKSTSRHINIFLVISHVGTTCLSLRLMKIPSTIHAHLWEVVHLL